MAKVVSTLPREVTEWESYRQVWTCEPGVQTHSCVREDNTLHLFRGFGALSSWLARAKVNVDGTVVEPDLQEALSVCCTYHGFYHMTSLASVTNTLSQHLWLGHEETQNTVANSNTQPYTASHLLLNSKMVRMPHTGFITGTSSSGLWKGITKGCIMFLLSLQANY